ncbi:MAG TPA: DUF4129 domain-containing protein [Bryobacteraceae bacterium]|nr:DUF4129 domain-containing protein [Bryobacteraceae bacterium]
MAGAREQSALDLLEEAVALLKHRPAVLAPFYIGTLPFALGFLYFWADMGRSPQALERCAPEALGVTVLFLWMSAWQAVFVQMVRHELTGASPAEFARLFAMQAALQPTKFLAIPVAILILLPLPACYAFYQNSMALPLAAARRQAVLWPKQNWMLLGFLTLIGFVTFFNLSILLIVTPYLMKMFLGIETSLTLGVNPLNSTFLAIAVALTYLVVDPIAKSVYTLRCFYGESIATGEDLKSRLKALSAALVLLVMLAGIPAYAQDNRVTELDHAIDNAMHRPEFAWRLPKATHPTVEDKSFAARLLDWTDQGLRKIDHWVDEFLRWVHEKFQSKDSKSRGSLPALKAWFYVLLVAAAIILTGLLVRAFRKTSQRRERAKPVAAAGIEAIEDAHAGEQPPDEWVRMAREAMARGDYRVAVRGLFLATLSYLGSQALISLDRGKSNRDYTRELRRRARTKPELLASFSGTVGIFERAWYGMHEVTPEMVGQLEGDFTQLRSYVEQ